MGIMFWNKKNKKPRVILDYASITPIAPEVAEKIRQAEMQSSANPSALYAEAIVAKENLTQARQSIGQILNCQKSEITFTSGGTEGNNLALLGIFEAHKTVDFKPHFITTAIEHSSVLEVCKEIERRGGEVTVLPVNPEGFVLAKDIATAIKENTVLVSVMYANNEIGTIEPIKEIGQVIKDWRQRNKTHLPYFHTDACQAPLFLNLDVSKLGVDMMTLDGIKIYGPRGAGILFVRSNVHMKPMIFGGGQEKGLRSGTESVGNAIGLATALEIAAAMREKESARLSEIRDYAIEKILKTFGSTTLNGSQKNRLPNNINICFPGLDAEFAVIALDVAGISASYSSSCQTLKEDSSSYVVLALDKSECGLSSLRFTLGRKSTKNDIDALIIALHKIVLK